MDRLKTPIAPPLGIKSTTGISSNTKAAYIITAICVSIAFCEWVFTYYNVAYGIILALFLALVIYIVIPIVKLEQAFTDSAESLVLIPLYILFTSSLPWFFLLQDLLIPAVYSTILALCGWHIYRKNISFSDIGLKGGRLTMYILTGIAVGIPLGAFEYFIITPVPSMPVFDIRYLFRDLVYMLFFVGLGEEILFRGLVQRDMTNLFGWKWGLVGASLMFMVMHLTWHSIPELGFTLFAGLVFGYMYYRTKNLIAPVVAHGVGNTILVAIMPYLFGI